MNLVQSSSIKLFLIARVNKRVSPPKNKTAVSRVHCGQISKPTGTNKFSTQPTQKISKVFFNQNFFLLYDHYFLFSFFQTN